MHFVDGNTTEEPKKNFNFDEIFIVKNSQREFLHTFGDSGSVSTSRNETKKPKKNSTNARFRISRAKTVLLHMPFIHRARALGFIFRIFIAQPIESDCFLRSVESSRSSGLRLQSIHLLRHEMIYCRYYQPRLIFRRAL